MSDQFLDSIIWSQIKKHLIIFLIYIWRISSLGNMFYFLKRTVNRVSANYSQCLSLYWFPFWYFVVHCDFFSPWTFIKFICSFPFLVYLTVAQMCFFFSWSLCVKEKREGNLLYMFALVTNLCTLEMSKFHFPNWWQASPLTMCGRYTILLVSSLGFPSNQVEKSCTAKNNSFNSLWGWPFTCAWLPQ